MKYIKTKTPKLIGRRSKLFGDDFTPQSLRDQRYSDHLDGVMEVAVAGADQLRRSHEKQLIDKLEEHVAIFREIAGDFLDTENANIQFLDKAALSMLRFCEESELLTRERSPAIIRLQNQRSFKDSSSGGLIMAYMNFLRHVALAHNKFLKQVIGNLENKLQPQKTEKEQAEEEAYRVVEQYLYPDEFEQPAPKRLSGSEVLKALARPPKFYSVKTMEGEEDGDKQCDS